MTSHSSIRRFGVWSSLAGGGSAQILAAAGPDWVALDAQHGTYDDAGIRETVAALAGVVPVWVRVAVNAPAVLGRALDAGAAGVVIPMVDTADQAAAAAGACRYPPEGIRSWGPMGALVGRPAPAAPEANAAVMCAVMVETAAGVANAHAIAATPGIDMIFVGPFDLALSLGLPVDELLRGTGPDNPLDRIVQVCAAQGIRAGAFGGDATRAQLLFDRGFSDVAVLTDSAVLATESAAQLARWRGTAPAAGSGGY